MDEGFRREITPLAKLAEWASQADPGTFAPVREVVEEAAPKCSKELVPAEPLPTFRAIFEQGERKASYLSA
jgi:hypothetical protein